MHLLHSADRYPHAGPRDAQGQGGGCARDPDRHRHHPQPLHLPQRPLRVPLRRLLQGVCAPANVLC